MIFKGSDIAGWGLAAFGLAAFVLTVLVVIPTFNDGSRYDYWSKWSGGDSLSMASLVVLPTAFFDAPSKLSTLSMLVGATGFIGLRSPIFLATLPTLAWRLLSKESGYWGPGWHYSAVLMPIAFVALVDGAQRAQRARWTWLRSYSQAVVPAVLAGSIVMTATQLPLRDLVNPATYAPSPREAAARRLLSMIPDQVTVETDIGLMTRLTGRARVFWVGDAEPVQPDFVVIDQQAGWSSPVDEPVAYAQQLHPSSRYTLVFDEDDYYLLRRVP